MKNKLKHILSKIWIYIKPFMSWRFLISYSIPFFLINGWAWMGTAMGVVGDPNWFTAVSASWLAFLWMPFCPEKLVSVPIAIWIHTKLFSDDGKTQEALQEMYTEAKSDFEKVKTKLKK